MTANRFVEFQDLTVGYRRGFQLGPLNMTFASGITCLLGANGAGKSTLLRCMAGLQRPLTGQIARSSPYTGYLPQDFVPPMSATPLQFLHYVAWLYGVRVDERSELVSTALKRVKLLDQSSVKIKTLSGGMQRRLGIAHTLVSKSSIIILDEPTVGLDPLQVTSLLMMLRDIAENVAVWVSTHQLHVARAIADNLIVLGDQRVQFHGPAETIPLSGQGTEEGFGTWVRELMASDSA